MDMNCNYVEEVSSVTLNHTKSIDKQSELIKINLPLTDDEKQTSETDYHPTGNSLILNNYRALDEPRSIISVNGANALGVGDIDIIGRIEGHEVCITLKNVLYIPTSPVTIVSQLRFENKGCQIRWSTNWKYNHTTIYDQGEPVLAARRLKGSRDLYETTFRVLPKVCFLTNMELHIVLGHSSDDKT